MAIIRLADVERSKYARSARRLEARVAEITEVLVELGGGAHRDQVIDRLALRRGLGAASAALAEEYIAAFEQHVAEVTARGMTPIFHLPFGPGSRRWALTVEARRHLQGLQVQA